MWIWIESHWLRPILGDSATAHSAVFILVAIVVASILVILLQMIATATIRGPSKRELKDVINSKNDQFAVLPDHLKIALASMNDRTNNLYSQAVYFLDRSFATMRYLIYFGCMLILLSVVFYIVMGKRDEAILSASSGILLNLISVLQSYVSKAGSRFEKFQNVLVHQNNLMLAICFASQLEDASTKNNLITQAVQSLMKVQVSATETADAASENRDKQS